MTAKNDSDDERRVARRHLACLAAHLELEGDQDPHVALIDNISNSGALLLTRVALEEGESVALQLILAADPAPETHEVSAQVVRSERRDPSTAALWPHAVAVTFDQTLDHLEARLKEIADGQR